MPFLRLCWEEALHLFDKSLSIHQQLCIILYILLTHHCHPGLRQSSNQGKDQHSNYRLATTLQFSNIYRPLQFCTIDLKYLSISFIIYPTLFDHYYMLKNKSLFLIIAIVIITVLITTKFYTKHTWIKKNTFEYQFLDRAIKPLNSETFHRDKNKLIQQIKSSNNNNADDYILRFRELVQGSRCHWVFNDRTEKSIQGNHDSLFSQHDRNTYLPIQKEVLSTYINDCINLFEVDENYIQMVTRLQNDFDATVPSTKNGSDLKLTVGLNKRISLKIREIKLKTQLSKTKLKSEKDKTTKQMLRHKISTSKGQIWKLRNKYRERYNAILKSTQSPDAIISILYNYKNTLPHQWYLGILYKLTGIEDRFITSLTENHYFDDLIISSADLYVCSLGYLCDENAYLMYFQCLGIKYKANEKACGIKVYDYYFTDFLTENMQIDALKIIDYFKDYANE